MLLNDEFISKYPDFPEAMKPLGKFVYYRTYSRYLYEEKRRETWKETVRRAIEYNCSLDKNTTSEEAEFIFDNVFNLRQFPSGRTLWTGGTKVSERYPMSNFNCLRSDTEFLTDKGIKTFNDFSDGDYVNVLDKNGAWSKAQIKNFGKQKLIKLVLNRSKAKKEIYTTAKHIWFVDKYNDSHFKETTTDKLKVGDTLREKRRYEHQELQSCSIGIQHGIVYGDGTYDKFKNHCRISLQGDKKELLKYFTTGSTCSEGDRDSICVYGLPSDWKQLPDVNMNYEYWKGFIIGLIASDGSTTSGGVSIPSTKLNELKIIRGMAEVIGVPTYDIRICRAESNFGDYSPCYSFNFIRDLFPKDMLIRTSQIKSFSCISKNNWKVFSIEETDLYEDVWCVIEPKTNTFTLSGGILTHNCSFIVMNDLMKLPELFYLLMIGTGVGIRILLSDVAKIQNIRTDVKVLHEKYVPVPKTERLQTTILNLRTPVFAEIIVSDNKEGWCDALKTYLEILIEDTFKDVKTIIFNYDNVRPKGEPLKTFGGTASGHVSLKHMFTTISKVIDGTLCKDYPAPSDGKLSTVNIYDIDTAIGKNVICGGVRRTAENHLLDHNDIAMIRAKKDLFIKDSNGDYSINKSIEHRRMSNNSIFYEHKPSREYLHWQMEELKYNGEPCFLNVEAARKRREDCQGVNPCFEVLLNDRGLCNLTTINVMAFVENGTINLINILAAQKYSVRMALRITLPVLELPLWNEAQKSHIVTGCSLTGWEDAMKASNMSSEAEEILMKTLKGVAKKEAEKYAKELGIEVPTLVTTIKPEGTLSKVAGVSEGLHFVQNDYCIIRVRINGDDPLAKVAMYLGWNMNPENGEDWTNYTTLVIDFPVHYTSKTKGEVSAIEQLEIYKSFQKNYTDHNTSNTISVKDNEWEEVEQWLWDNWDDMIGVSFIGYDNNVYPLAPQESTSVEKYTEMVSNMKPFDEALLPMFEQKYKEFDIIEEQCVHGACTIR